MRHGGVRDVRDRRDTRDWRQRKNAEATIIRQFDNSLIQSISAAAQSVLDARSLYPGSSLADLYDPLTMPPELVKAHARLDALVDRAYGLSPSCADSERVAHLFALYAERVEKLKGGEEEKLRREEESCGKEGE